MIANSLFGTNPSSEPMLTYFELDNWEQIKMICVE